MMIGLSSCIITCAYLDIRQASDATSVIISYLSLASTVVLGLISAVIATHFMTLKPERKIIPLEF